MSVDSLMQTEHLPLVPPDMPLHQVLDEMDRGQLGAVFILGAAGTLEGVFTDGDLRRTLGAGRLMPESLIKKLMTVNPKRARLGQSVAELIDLMEAKAITILPVVDENDKPVGVVHLHDLLGKGRIRFSG